MQAKGLLILTGITALVAVVAAMMLQGEAAETTEAGTDAAVYAGLVDRVNDVERVVLTKESDVTTLTRSEGGWNLMERGGYPVQFSKVKEAVMNVARLEIREKKTKNPSYHERLGVDEASAPRIALFGPGDEQLADLVVGESKPTGVYVRREGEDQVYLCKGALRIDTDPKSWIEREILRLESDRVQEVTVKHADGSVVVVGRNPDNHTQFQLKNAPEGREEDYAGVANSVGTALSYLSLEDVLPLSEVGLLQDDPIATTRYLCTDGLEVEALVANHDGKKWVRIDARYVGPPEGVEPPAEEADDTIGPPAEPAEDAEDPDEDRPDPAVVKAEAADIGARLARWAFQIPDYKASAIAKPMEDLLKDLEEEPEAVQGDESASLDDIMGGIEPVTDEELIPEATSPDEGGDDPEVPADPPADDGPVDPGDDGDEPSH